MLQLLVVRDGDRSPGARSRRGALGSQRTRGARLGVEFNESARHEGFRLTCGAGDRARAHVDREVALAEERPIARNPWFAKHFAAAREDLGGEGTVDVAA